MDNNTLAEVREALEWVRTELRGTQYKERFAQISQALAKLDALIEAQGWQHIETAPKDRRVLVWTGQERYMAHWSKNPFTDDEAWIVAEWGEEGDQELVKPIAWTEAPPPPSNEEMNDGK